MPNTSFLDLTNRQFGKLTIISRAPNIKEKIRERTAWNCQCKCGARLIVMSRYLTNGSTTCCPKCKPPYYGNAIKPNQVFTYLTTISYHKGIWTCQCKCGKIKKVDTHRLMSGNTGSCGCLRIETATKQLPAMIAKNTIYSYREASAREIYLSYLTRHLENNHSYDNFITFEQFLHLSQHVCFYCGILPSNCYNYASGRKNCNITRKERGDFTYNGLDRLYDSSYCYHNIITSCFLCNSTKHNNTMPQFLNRITNMIVQPFIPITKLYTIPIPSHIKSSVKRIFTKRYKDDAANLTLEQFYTLSQKNCFYCQAPPSNKFNWAMSDKKSSAQAKATADFVYNGLDRIDNSQPHHLHNLVPCCKYCNFGKSNLSLSQFQDWIRTIITYQQSLQLNQALQLYYP